MVQIQICSCTERQRSELDPGAQTLCKNLGMFAHIYNPRSAEVETGLLPRQAVVLVSFSERTCLETTTKN